MMMQQPQQQHTFLQMPPSSMQQQPQHRHSPGSPHSPPPTHQFNAFAPLSPTQLPQHPPSPSTPTASSSPRNSFAGTSRRDSLASGLGFSSPGSTLPLFHQHQLQQQQQHNPGSGSPPSGSNTSPNFAMHVTQPPHMPRVMGTLSSSPLNTTALSNAVGGHHGNGNHGGSGGPLSGGTTGGGSSGAQVRRPGASAPAAILLRAESLDEASIMTRLFCFTVPRALRKVTKRHYREADQVVIFVAVGDIVVARAVIASDVLPRSIAARNVPEIEREIPAHWTNLFRVTNITCFTPRALELGFPCPVSDRSELPSALEPGFHVSRVWLSTLTLFVDATVALATGKSDHYDRLLRLINETKPTEEGVVPDEVKSLVSAVKMVSHGPGIVVLGYIAQRYGRGGREFIANSLFELNAGVIDLCRQTMGGGLISYLVRHGTCATPRILQLVPWRVVATRVLSDAVGSQTASLMLHSAMQFHRTTRRAVEPVAVTSLTHRVLTKNFADATDPSADCSLSAIAANAQSCRVLQLVVEACVELLAMHAAGLFDAAPEIVTSAQKVVNALCDLADKHAADAWSNYATQSLITACTLRDENNQAAIAMGRYFDSLLARVMSVIRPHILRLSCHKCGSNVIEKLCAARPNVTHQVALALLSIHGAFPRLAQDRYGNYVVQTLLQYLPQSLEVQVRDALHPVLSSLDPHWHCTVAIDGWCRAVADRQRRGSLPQPPGTPVLPIQHSSHPQSPIPPTTVMSVSTPLVVHQHQQQQQQQQQQHLYVSPNGEAMTAVHVDPNSSR